mgnify:FL=1
MMDRATQLWRWRFGSKVTAFTTTRLGGYSKGEYGEMNINPWVGDDPEAVRKNQELLCRQLRLRDTSRLVLPHQVHGTEFFQVGRDFLSLSPEERAVRLEGIDAVMTDVTSVAIGVSTADCVPVLLYDIEHHAACALHAGWRGCVKRIIPKALQAMKGAYGSQPGEVRALIGPCIMMTNYQVKGDVMEQFRQAGFDVRYFSMPTFLTREQEAAMKPDDRTWDLDLVQFCIQELTDAGVRKRRITATMRNTFRQADELFSARRQGIASGRNFTGIIL